MGPWCSGCDCGVVDGPVVIVDGHAGVVDASRNVVDSSRGVVDGSVVYWIGQSM